MAYAAEREADAVESGGIHWTTRLNNQYKVLLFAQKLSNLRGRPEDGRNSEETGHYDPLALALKLCEFVLQNTGLDVHMNDPDLYEVLRPLFLDMDHHVNKEPDRTRHLTILKQIMEVLSPFQAYIEPYPDYLSGTVIQREMSFIYLERRFCLDGETHTYRPTTELINLLHRSLSVPLEDLQKSTEALIEIQLEEGRYDEARSSAIDASNYSQLYRQQIDDVRRQIMQDVTSVPIQEIQERIERALKHIQERTLKEEALIRKTWKELDDLEDQSRYSEDLRKLLDLLEACKMAHASAYQVIQPLRQQYMVEQNRQVFTHQSNTQEIKPTQDILIPLLKLPQATINEQLRELNSFSLGARAPEIFSLSHEIESLLRPTRERAIGKAPVFDRETASTADSELTYAHELVLQGKDFLKRFTGTYRLSEVIREAEQLGNSQHFCQLLIWLIIKGFTDYDAHMHISRTDEHRYKTAWVECHDVSILFLPGEQA